MTVYYFIVTEIVLYTENVNLFYCGRCFLCGR